MKYITNHLPQASRFSGKARPTRRMSARANVPYQLQIGEKTLAGNAPSAPAWGKSVVFPVGKITIEKAGVYPVALRAGTDTNWGGFQLFNVTLKRIQ